MIPRKLNDTKVILESPYAGDILRNKLYLKRAMKHSFLLGELPFASHAMYTQCLRDSNHSERTQGINAGLAWGELADYVVVYCDYGISRGMEEAINHWTKLNKQIIYRKIGRIDEIECATIYQDLELITGAFNYYNTPENYEPYEKDMGEGLMIWKQAPVMNRKGEQAVAAHEALLRVLDALGGEPYCVLYTQAIHPQSTLTKQQVQNAEPTED